MIIQHNMPAINAQRQLGVMTGNKAKVMEKLSSGYRINRAADDAAGLAISEKMRRKIRGLTQGVKNTQEGVSLCQVADGALNEVSDMLHRISELSVKAANGTNTDTDRQYIQKEVSQIITEIDRIAETTEFNEIKLFDGEEVFGDGGFINKLKPSTDGEFFQLFGSSISKTGYMQEPLTPSMVDGSTSVMNTMFPYVSVHIQMDVLKDLSALVDTTFFVNCCTNCCPTTVLFTDNVGIKSTVGKLEIGMKKADGSYFDNAADFCKYVVDEMQGKTPNHVEFGYKGSKLYIYDIDNHAWGQHEKEAAYFCDSKEIYGEMKNMGKKLWIHSGNEPGDGIWLSIGNMSAASLGVKGLDVSTVGGAESAMDSTKLALQILMMNRSTIGAQQNRLEHTIANEENIIENLTASESRIRDTDIAKEMVRLSNISILEQAGVSMLAQANASRESVLSLL